MMDEGSVSSLAPAGKNESDMRNVGKSSLRKLGFPNTGRIYSQHRRASIGSCSARDSTRKNSIERLDSTNKSQESIPHYLRASTGSCHDFCKYGRKHAFEAKERHSIPKRVAKSLSSVQNSLEKIVPGERKKKMVPHQKASSSNKSHLQQHKPSPDAKSFPPKPKPSLDTQVCSPEKKASPRDNTQLQMHKPSSIKKLPAPYPPEIIKREIELPSEKFEVHSSIGNNMRGSENKTKNVSSEHFSSESLKTITERPLSPPNISVGINGKGRRNGNVKIGRELLPSKASVKKAMVPQLVKVAPKISLSRTVSLKGRKAISSKMMSPLKNRTRKHKAETKRSTDEKIPEKNLHVFKTEDSVIQSHPSPSSLVSSSLAKSPSTLSHEGEKEETEYEESEVDEMISKSNDTVEVGKVKMVEEKHIKVLRKCRAIGSEDKDSSPVKLKFRRGKIVDLKSDNSSPRILRFRKGRASVDDQGNKGDLGRKTFNNHMANSDKNGTDPSSEKVNLKHQDVQGKTNTQGLLNNVIEETASKLVESRKSKVKALVGAFETVISLQESKHHLQDAT